MRENYRHLRGSALLAATAQENVLVQLQHLETYPVVAARLARGDLHLHGWMYKIETGEVFHYDPRAKQFVLIEHARPPVDQSRSLSSSLERATA